MPLAMPAPANALEKQKDFSKPRLAPITKDWFQTKSGITMPLEQPSIGFAPLRSQTYGPSWLTSMFKISFWVTWSCHAHRQAMGSTSGQSNATPPWARTSKSFWSLWSKPQKHWGFGDLLRGPWQLSVRLTILSISCSESPQLEPWEVQTHQTTLGVLSTAGYTCELDQIHIRLNVFRKFHFQVPKKWVGYFHSDAGSLFDLIPAPPLRTRWAPPSKAR